MTTEWTPPGEPDELDYLLTVYGAAVAKEVLKAGIQVCRGSVYVSTDPEVDESEAEITLGIPSSYARRFIGQDLTDLGLDWDSVSGWSLWMDPQKAVGSKRWMSGGLVPDAAQVASFLTTALVDLNSTGTEERPYYRPHLREDFTLLLDRLRRAAPEWTGGWYSELGDRLRDAGHAALFTHAARDMAAQTDDIRLVPVRGGEVRALGRLLDWASGEDEGRLRELMLLFADDLQQRWSSAGTTPVHQRLRLADEHRHALDYTGAQPHEQS